MNKSLNFPDFINIKKHIPLSLKKVPWYIFKSPQRVLGLWRTLGIEINGIVWQQFSVLGKHKLKPVSICTGLKNRSRNYLDFVIESILKMEQQDLIEVSVFDCKSSDIPDLEMKIRGKWKGTLIFNTEDCDFTRSYTFNKAIRQSHNPLIFAADADMSLPTDLVEKCNRYVSRKSVWFPICFHLFKDKPAIISHENGEWHPVGKGMFASSRKQFEHIGGFDEKYISWGGEDWDIWLRFFDAGLLPIRTRLRGLFHHYHPSLKPEGGIHKGKI